jgi:hypothetical protein
METGESKPTKLSEEHLNEYRVIISKTLHKHSIPKSDREDLANDLLYVLYKADTDFNGLGSIHGYRKIMINFYIKNFLNKLKKRKIFKQQIINDNSICYNDYKMDYLSDKEKNLLLDRYVYKNAMRSFSKEEQQIMSIALEKVKYNENID